MFSILFWIQSLPNSGPSYAISKSHNLFFLSKNAEAANVLNRGPEFFLVIMTAQQEADGRILLGDNTGSGVGVLRLITFQCGGVWTAVGLPLRSWPYLHSIPTCAKIYSDQAFPNYCIKPWTARRCLWQQRRWPVSPLPPPVNISKVIDRVHNRHPEYWLVTMIQSSPETKIKNFSLLNVWGPTDQRDRPSLGIYTGLMYATLSDFRLSWTFPRFLL